MNKVDLTNIGGFPLEQDSLDFLQAAYGDMFASLANYFGNKVILSGVKVVGANVTDGWISYNGEIIKFIGGAAGPNVGIFETLGDATFEDTTIKHVYKTRFAAISTPGTFPFSDLSYARKGPALGTVEMFSGQLAKIPADYALCDGALLNITDFPQLYDILGIVHGGDGVTTFALPNLKGRFIAGYDGADADYNGIANVGGEKKHILTIAEMPTHGHGITSTNSAASVNDLADVVRGSAQGTVSTRGAAGAGKTITQTGGGLAHESRPPFYTLAFIIKLL